MRTVSPSKSRGYFRNCLIILTGAICLAVVVFGVSAGSEPSSGLSGSAGIGQMTDTPPPIIVTVSTEPPISTKPQGASEQPTLASIPAQEDEIVDAKSAPMRFVRAGEYAMGGLEAVALTECRKLYIGGTCEQEWFSDEAPLHTVYLDEFYMDKYEVSNALYRECVNSDVCKPPANVGSNSHSSYYDDPQYDDYPVINIDWYMADTYCKWRGARLPTEAEWEKAARSTDGRIYPWGNSFAGMNVNFCDENCCNDGANTDYNDGYADTAPVDSYPAGMSEFGIYNLAGNVWEWVADWYGETYYANSPFSNPTGPISGEARVARGGSWNDFGDVVRASNRNWVRATFFNNVLGFRCVR
jgi:formylglycine-generating enzyme required for sulfatase activity